MALLLEDAAANTTGDTVALTSPCTVYVDGTIKGTSVVELQIKSANTEFHTVHRFSESDQKPVIVDPLGAYSIRAVLAKFQVGTSVTIEAVES